MQEIYICVNIVTYVNQGNKRKKYMEDRLEGTKRLTLVIPAEWHKDVKRFALNRNMSVKDLVMRAIVEFVDREKKFE